MVGVALDVGVATLGIHATARAPHVAQEKLQHRARPDELPARGVVCEAHRVHDRHHLVRLAHLADQVRDLVEIVDRDAGDARNDIGRVARVMLLHQLKDRSRILEGQVALGEPCRRIGVVAPGCDVVAARRSVVAGEETVVERVTVLDEE